MRGLYFSRVKRGAIAHMQSTREDADVSWDSDDSVQSDLSDVSGTPTGSQLSGWPSEAASTLATTDEEVGAVFHFSHGRMWPVRTCLLSLALLYSKSLFCAAWMLSCG